MIIVKPGDPGYNQLRTGYNKRYTSNPSRILLPTTAKEVSQAVRSSKNFVIRSGGHSYDGQSLSNGTIIDLQLMKNISFIGNGQIRVEPGVRIQELYRILNQHGVVLPCGTCPTVGIGGITLSGGIGYLTRKYGLTLDSLVAAEVILADGSIITISKDRYPDLFWAIRGGGGSFCAVAAYIFKVYSTIPAIVFNITWEGNVDFLSNILYQWQKWSFEAPSEMTCSLELEASKITCEGVYLTDNQDKVLQLLQPILFSAKVDLTHTTASQAMIMLENKITYNPIFKMKSGIVNRYASKELFKLLLQSLQGNTQNQFSRRISFYPQGEFINSISPIATSFVHRDSIFWIQLSAYWKESTSEQEALQWINNIYNQMQPYMSGYVYQNWPSMDVANWQNAYYGINYPRLQQIKKKYDPHNRFHFKQSIELPSN